PASTNTVTTTLVDKVVIMQESNPEALVNGKKILLDAPPQIRQGRTFVPIRFISEAFGAIVEWDAATRTVTVIYEK
ncbi:MAG: copper amine oxidase N-terminal domain-containing protein, partial [Bacteroidales bacterium]